MESNDESGSQLIDTAMQDSWKWRQILQQTSSCPSPRHLHSLVQHNNILYVFGGFGDDEKYLDDFWQFSLVKRRWKKIKLEKQPSARHSHQAVVYENRMILFGGLSDGKTMNDVWSFDFVTESWKSEGEQHFVWGHSMVVFEDKLVLFGGADKKHNVLANVVVLDARTLEPIPTSVGSTPSPRQYASILVHNGAIYLFGGFNKSSLRDFYKICTDEHNQIVTKSLEVPPFMQGLQGASLLPFHSQLIVFGGRTKEQKLSDVTYSFALEEYHNSGLSNWLTRATVGPSPRYHHQVCELNGSTILFGGLGLKEGSDRAVNLKDMWIFTDQTVDIRQEHVKFDSSSIPTEIWHVILTHLAHVPKSVASSALVSKQFCKIVKNDEMLTSKRRYYVSLPSQVLPEIKNDIIKICIAGRMGSGKSATAIQFGSHQFVEDQDPDVEECYCWLHFVDGAKRLLEVTDSAVTPDYSSMSYYFTSAHGLYFVFSITNRASFADLDNYMELAVRVKKSKKFPLIIVGNMSDMAEDRQVSREEAQEYADKHGAMYIETSAKTGHNISEAFTMLVSKILAVDEARKSKTTTPGATNKRFCLVM